MTLFDGRPLTAGEIDDTDPIPRREDGRPLPPTSRTTPGDLLKLAADGFAHGLTVTEQRAVARGQHPTGRPLGPEASRCKTCVHRIAVEYHGKTYTKCEIDRERWTHGRGGDIRIRWRGCDVWRLPTAEEIATEKAREAEHEAMMIELRERWARDDGRGGLGVGTDEARRVVRVKR